MSYIDEGDKEELAAAEEWYYEYDDRANNIITKVNKKIDPPKKLTVDIKPDANVKIQKLKLPNFDSSPKNYYKWKSTFERYMKYMDDDTKYDYLFSYTEGTAHEYVSNKSVYVEAMAILDEKFGNKHVILKLLLDDIRRLPIVKRGDFTAFENLSFKASNFRDRLIEMELEDEVENSYILHEIEYKMNADDLQRWFESLKDAVDRRKVADLVTWLDRQTHIRRLTQLATVGSNDVSYKRGTSFGASSNMYRKEGDGRFNSNPITNNAESSSTCHLCQGSHIQLTECPVFPLISFNEKWTVVKSMNVCFICLMPGHQRTECTEMKCDLCARPHHKLLHNPRRLPERMLPLNHDAPPYTSGAVRIRDTSERKNCKKRTPGRSLLPIVKMMLKSRKEDYLCKALLDSGSEINVMSTMCCNRLHLNGYSVMISIIGAGGVVSKRCTKLVAVTVIDNSGIETEIECIVLDETCGKAIPMKEEVVEQFKDYDVTINSEEEEIDVLVGMSSPQFHKHRIVRGKPNCLTLIETPFGYCVVGPVPNDVEGNYRNGLIRINNVTIVDDKVNDEINFGHLEAEMAGIYKECQCSTKTDDEILFDKIMETAWKRSDDGRFQVRIPWKMDPKTLDNNRTQAISRDIRLVAQLSKKPEVMALFKEQMNNMIEDGILRQVNEHVPKRYLPLLAIVNLNRTSTKVRVCLDAKAKYKGISLNDALLKGKMEMNGILQVLTRFRMGENAILGDIQKMYWQILLHPEDQIFHGVIWKGTTYIFTRVCFGDNNSPPIADYSMKRIAVENKETHARAYDVLMKKRYMDDVVDAKNDEQEIIYTKNETDEILGEYGFKIKEWYSNNHRVGKVEDNKVLGLKWSAEKDDLSIIIKRFEEKEILTKRSILSTIASIWDPLGMCTAFLMRGRLIFQSVVRLKTDWDEQVQDAELQRKWKQWLSRIGDCANIVVGRNLFPSKQMNRCCLVGFSDGSSLGFGCVVYLRWTNDDESEVQVKFIAAKGKVGPINGNTVPRMELSGSLILARLLHCAQVTLEEVPSMDKEPILCTDSSTVLAWINSEAIRYRPYVKNKIIEIQDLHPVKAWRYVPSTKNKAADLISKGCDVKDVNVIIEGPDLLKVPLKEWPNLGKEKEETDEDKELIISANAAKIEEPLIDICKHNDWQKLLRITAYA